MQRKTEQLLINGCIATLGALAVALKAVEWANAWVKWQAKGETIKPTTHTAANPIIRRR